MNVITWNMQGATGFGESKWNTDVSRLFQANAEVICLQECGNPPPTAIPTAAPAWLAGHAIPGGGYQWQYFLWNLGTQSRPYFINILWIETDPVGHRVNLAIAFSAAAVAALNLIYITPGIVGTRPAIGVRVPYGGATLDIYTLHAISPGGADGPNLINNIIAVGAPGGFCAGDYNTDPNTWAGVLPAAAVVCPHNGVVTHPGSGTNLDYAIKSAAGGAIQGSVFTGFVVSDHYPVAYLL